MIGVYRTFRSKSPLSRENGLYRFIVVPDQFFFGDTVIFTLLLSAMLPALSYTRAKKV